MFKILSLLYQELAKLSWHEYLVISALAVWFALIVFYTLYLAAINVWDNRQYVSGWIVALSGPMLLAMVVCDVFMNMTIFTVLMMDLPREGFVTTRMKRYRAQAVFNWRSRVASFICNKLLNPFDPTKHHC